MLNFEGDPDYDPDPGIRNMIRSAWLRLAVFDLLSS